jgi:hypothetical protein
MGTRVLPPDLEDELDHKLGCEQAMEVAFARLLSDAVVAGWGEIEVAMILADLADDHVLRLARRNRRRKLN